jgi:NAD(P)-dependent dehydrogenase (short-subunit alcohol dehydrogenase family)
MADHFLEEGCLVAVCDIDPGAVAAFAEARPGTLAAVADVTSETDMTAFFRQVEEAWGGADVVCANAGIGGPAGGIETLDYGAWQTCVAVNLHGAFLTCRWAAGVMKPQGSGVITITSSNAGLFGYPLRSPYAAAKWALIGLTKTLAMELGPYGIRVNAICPGSVEGPRMDRVLSNVSAASGMSEAEVRDSYTRFTSLRTWVLAEEVAETAAWLASDAARKISGQALAVDGHTEAITS